MTARWTRRGHAAANDAAWLATAIVVGGTAWLDAVVGR